MQAAVQAAFRGRRAQALLLHSKSNNRFFLRNKMTIVNTGAKYNAEIGSAQESLASTHVIDHVPMNGSLKCNLEGAAVNIEMFPTWSERFEARYHSEAVPAAGSEHIARFLVTQLEQGAEVLVSEDPEWNGSFTEKEAGTLKLFVPEHFNISLAARKANVNISDKLQGSLVVDVEQGDVTVNKIRGDIVDLQTRSGDIEITKAAEGVISLAASRQIEARTLLGPSLAATATSSSGSVSFGAVYCKQSKVKSEGAVSIGTIHGALQVVTNGSINVDSMSGEASLQTFGDASDVSAHFDLIVPSTTSNIQTVQGNASVTFTSPVKVKLRASANVGNGGEQSSDPLVSINAGGGSFTGQSGSTELDGELVTLDVEDWATKEGVNSGKITHAGRTNAALSFLPQTSEETPVVDVQTQGGKVHFDVWSWMDMMSKQIGLPKP